MSHVYLIMRKSVILQSDYFGELLEPLWIVVLIVVSLAGHDG